MDNDFLGINGEIEDDEGFELALQKKQFQGKKGNMLMELQKSYKGDDRFVFDKKFKNDVDTKLVSRKLKNTTDVFDEQEKKEIFKKEISEEKNKNMNILSSILTNEEFFTFNNKKPNPKKLIIKRFDPALGLGNDLIIKKEEKKVEENVIKLEKGVSRKKNFENQNDYNRMNSKDKQRVMSKVMDEANKIFETKVEVKYDSLKNVFKKESKNNYCLFGGSINQSEKDNVEEESKESIKEIQPHSFELFSIPDTIKEEDELLNKKKLKTKKKNQQKKIKGKQKREEKQQKCKNFLK
jgi:hypothetical protein